MSLGLKLETCEIVLSCAIVYYHRPPSCFYCGGCCAHVLPCTLAAAVDMPTSWLLCVVICPKFDPSNTSFWGETSSKVFPCSSRFHSWPWKLPAEHTVVWSFDSVTKTSDTPIRVIWFLLLCYWQTASILYSSPWSSTEHYLSLSSSTHC